MKYVVEVKGSILVEAPNAFIAKMATMDRVKPLMAIDEVIVTELDIEDDSGAKVSIVAC
jgi:hypothetical protein